MTQNKASFRRHYTNESKYINDMKSNSGAQLRREKFPTRTIRLVGQQQLDTALVMLARVPLDAEHPLELIVREEVKPRRLDANALMWVGPLRDISEQAYIFGRTYSAEVWHHQFKEDHLPAEFDPELCLEGYRKWDHTPTGDRILIGSTTQLTVKGFAQYLEQVMADGASMGVLFSVREK